MKKMYRQGDVLLERVNKIPTGLRLQKASGRIILAHGEVTGHHHSIDADAADWWKGDGNEQYVEVKMPAEVVHQEHGAISILPGKYKVRRQREYAPGTIRNVAD